MSSSNPPLAIRPIYSTPETNQIIKLYEGPIAVITETGRWPGTGVIEQQWLPTPAIRIDCSYKAPEMLDKPSAQIALPDTIETFDVTVTSMGLGIQGSNTYATLKGLPNSMKWGTSELLRKIVFHIPNFAYFEGALVQDSNANNSRNARATVHGDGWTISVDSLSGFTFTEIMALEKSSGNGITHAGMIQRADGSLFPASVAQEFLKTLYQWLSFCRGNWVAPILAVGLNDHDKEVWKDWRQWNIRRCEQVGTWANRENPDFMEKTLSGYLIRCKDSLWFEPIKLALSWYVECNRRASGMEASIILGQTSLELLGWTALVEDQKIISSNGFNDLPAADKIRLLLASYQIPLDIPAYLSALSQLAKANNWLDGPECLVGMRNALVHPQPKNRKKVQSASNVAIYEVWNLGLRYLDLIFLKLFNYEGVYRNRLKRECSYDETLEKVPWSK